MKEFLGGLLSFVGLAFFGYGIFRIFKPREEQGRKQAIWLAVAGFIVMGIGGALNPQEEQQATKETPRQEETTVKQKKEEKIDWATAEVTEETVRAALERKPQVDPVAKDRGFPKNITEIEISDLFEPEGKKKVVIRFKPESIWDETDFLKKVGGTAIVAASLLYENEGIHEVVLLAQAKMTDQYGVSELEDVIRIGFNREIVDKIDWEGLANRHATDPGNIYRIIDNRYIHLGILKNVKRDEVQL